MMGVEVDEVVRSGVRWWGGGGCSDKIRCQMMWVDEVVRSDVR